MSLLHIYIHDDRYAVPTWRTVELRITDGVAFAQHLMESNNHYRRVDLWLEDQQIVSVELQAA